MAKRYEEEIILENKIIKIFKESKNNFGKNMS